LLYGYSDYQGSLIALTDENGTVVEQYAYDPWGNRRNPADWTASDTRTSWRLNSGYTGHEHLDAFAIINMNGRVYDPLTGMFFSPDPQLQDPGNWMNYNRYGYCYNNPLLYTDPSGEFLTWSISKHGFSIGINGTPAGLPYGAGINIGWDDGFSLGGYVEVGPRVGGTGFGSGATISQSLDFNFKNKDWSTSTSAGGYASLGSFNAGANMSFTNDMTNNSSYSSWGVSVGIGISNQQGGLGVNVGYGSNGFTYGIGGYYNAPIYNSNPQTSDLEEDEYGAIERAKASIGTNAEKDAFLKEMNINPDEYGVRSIEMENSTFPDYMVRKGYTRGETGLLYHGKRGLTGTTYLEDGWFPKSIIYMSPNATERQFHIALDHEFIHSWQWQNFGHQMESNSWGSFKEASAMAYTKMFYPNAVCPNYNGIYNLYYWPKNLLMP